ncbi:MAG: DUF4956 domain-containing protein [Clostridiales Family XIII bacterium]|jgi:hypothetical protein|nr:DUF4956 domain-containing protein [Clostridiales Family XIII bacterium]
MFESIFATSVEMAIMLPGLLAALGSALVMGLVISFVYMKTHKTKSPSQSFALTFVLLPAVVAIIILLVGNNVARAFSLAGAFSIIRFRSAPGDPKDITYVLFSMAVGLAAGMGYVLYAAIVGLVLCAVMVLLELFKYGRPKGIEKILKITVPENLDFQDTFDIVMEKYTTSFRLRRMKTADLGSLYELNYAVVTKDGINEKAFIDELRCRNGNLNITLVLDAPSNTEF